jgi:hypothetical protein
MGIMHRDNDAGTVRTYDYSSVCHKSKLHCTSVFYTNESRNTST